MRASAIGKFGAVTSKKNGAVVPTALRDEADRHEMCDRTDDTRHDSNAKPGRSVLARNRWVHRWPSPEALSMAARIASLAAFEASCRVLVLRWA